MKRLKQLMSQFRVPKGGKISDKTMTLNLVSCVVGILLCVSSLTAATWAWFQADIASSANVIQAANYNIAVTVSMDDTAATVQTDGTPEETASLAEESEGGYTFVAEKNGTYTVLLTCSGSASTGYCKLEIGEKSYYTDQLPMAVEDGDPLKTMTFKLELIEGTRVTFIPCWGTYKEESRDISDGGEYTLSAERVLEPLQANPIETE